VTPRRWTALVAAVTAALAPLLVTVPASAGDTTVVTTREVLGTSVDGRPIVAVHRVRATTAALDPADPAAAGIRRVLVIGNIHGDEQAGLRVVRRLLAREHLPAELDLWLIRTVNPDGTAADRRTNAHGVDLNRNFRYLWHSSPRGATWSGKAPLSEPESVVLRDLIRRLRPDLTVIFHQPLFGVGATDKGMPTVRALARGMRLPVDEFHCTGVCYGTFSGWVNHRTEGLAVTVEFGSRVPSWRIGRAASTVLEVGAALPRQ
jgi:murein peptide amidase A